MEELARIAKPILIYFVALAVVVALYVAWNAGHPVRPAPASELDASAMASEVGQ